MVDEMRVRDRAFELWTEKGRRAGLLNECLEQARHEFETDARRDAKAAGRATAPPGAQTRPGHLFDDPGNEQPPVDRRGRDIQGPKDKPLISTQKQGVTKH
jgi:hypothetical protein